MNRRLAHWSTCPTALRGSTGRFDVPRLIVNADDFGASVGVNRGILRAHTDGIVTSASLMVRGVAAADAVERAADCADLDLGLHIDLAEWVYRSDGWAPVYEVVDCNDVTAVDAEVRRQVGAFHELTGALPSHLDSHQHVHLSGPVTDAVVRIAAELEVPVRSQTPGIRYIGDFYGQGARGQPHPTGITVDTLEAIVSSLRPGTTELACHPADVADVDSVYREERTQELVALCSPTVRRSLHDSGVELTTFRALGPPPRWGTP